MDEKNKKIKIVRLFEEAAESNNDADGATNSDRPMPTIQIINYGNAKITSSDIQINITVTIDKP